MPSLNVSYRSGRSHRIVFDRIERLPALMAQEELSAQSCLLITDRNVSDLYSTAVRDPMAAAGWHVREIVIDPGEASKSLQVLSELFDTALASGIDRTTPIVALGGGVVGDLAGFCAATLLRGLPLIHVPTTLVAQVDSAIGGKTGINHPAGKNLIGSIYQPRLVLSDTRVLRTLDEREWRSGLGEVVKHAMLDSESHVTRLLACWPQLASRDPDVLDDVVPASAAVKVDVVTADEHESASRAVLNLGHTVGHAIEKAAGYGSWSHGEAVAAGMAIALRLSDLEYPGEARPKAWELLRRLGWPSVRDLDVDSIVSAVSYDKKRRDGQLQFVLLRSEGDPQISRNISAADIRLAWQWLIESS